MRNDYRYVMALYQEKNFSKAAKKLYISQPALSKAISNLEKELGTVLFDRSSNELRPTEACIFYMQCARQIDETENRIHEYFRSLTSLDEGTLTIGTTSFYCCWSLPKRLAPFAALHPNLNINLVEQTSNKNLAAQLKNGEIDLALSVNPHGFEFLSSRFFASEYLIMAVPAAWEINQKLKKEALSYNDIRSGYHKQSDCPAVQLEDFAQLPYLSLRPESELYGRVMGMFARHNKRPKIHMFSDQMPTTYFLSLYGYGYSIIRDTTLNTVPQPDQDQVVFYKIDDSLALRDVYFYFRDLQYQSQAVKAWLDFLN